MTLSESQKRASAKYKEKNIKRIPLDVQKDNYDEIKAAADIAGEKVNSYIKAAIEAQLSVVVLPLSQSITFNEIIQKELSEALMQHSDSMSGYLRESCTDGSANLTLKFKSKNLIDNEIVQHFTAILAKHGISVLSTAKKSDN